MDRLLKNIAYTLLALLAVGPCAGAGRVTYFESLTSKDGLSQMSILDITQDRQGYMWFATRDGLNRYDGHGFDVLRHDQQDSLSLTHNYVLCMAEDAGGYLWVGTLSGLNRYDPATQTFRRYYHDPLDQNSLSNNHIRRICVAASGQIWIGTAGGLNLLDPSTGTFTRYMCGGDIPDKRINALVETGGRLLVGTDHNLYVFDPRTGRAVRHLLTAEREMSVKCLFCHSSGSVWAGTFEDGLFELDGLTGVRRRWTHREGDPAALSNNSVRALAEDPDGHMLAATFNGINILDRTTGRTESFRQEPGQNNGITHFSFHSIYCDRAGTVWTGSWAGGINYCNYYRNSYMEYHIPADGTKKLQGIVGAMVEDREHGGIWIAMEGGGLLFYDSSRESYTHYPVGRSSNDDIRSNIVNSLYKQGHDLWAGTNNGLLCRFDTRTRRIVQSIPLPDSPSIVTITGDGHGNLLIGLQSQRGLVRVTPSGKITDTFMDRDGGQLELNNICSIIREGGDTFLLGSNSLGLYRYDISTGEYTFHELGTVDAAPGAHPVSVNLLYRDSRGLLWVATPQQGLFCLDGQYRTMRQYTIADGLSSNTVCGIVEDAAGNIWFSVYSAVYRISREDGTLKCFRGFRLSEFGLRSCYSTGERLFFGGNMGFVAFEPGRVTPDSDPPPVVIKGFSINNVPVRLREHDYLHRTTRLRYDQTGITIDYRALDYIHPEQVAYAYKLDGFDQEWNHFSDRLSAHYTNLPAGEYTFRVRAANADGVWNPGEATLSLKVLPPPWKSWWAYSLYMLAFAAAVGAYMRYLRIRMRLTSDIELKQIEKQNAEKLHEDRINLFTNFSHELRTPLTLILAPLEELEKRTDLPAGVHSSLDMIQRNARRLLLLVNQLMDFRKREAGSMKVAVAGGDFPLFIHEILLAFSQLARTRRIELSYSDKDSGIEVWYDRDLMEKVMFNLLSNAFKNTPDGGRITLAAETIEHDGNWIRVEVSDTGRGIPQDKLSEIFNPFYQIKDGRGEGAGGTGIGLNLTQGIIELHHGRIWAESTEGQGARFIFELPLGNGHFSREEIIGDYRSSEDISRYISYVDLPADADAQIVQPAKKQYTVLVAEDNPEVRGYIAACLAATYNVIEAADGERAFMRCVEAMPDLVVSDVMMPVVDGIELCRRLKADLRTGHIPVVLLTARVTIMQIEEGLRIGADDYITKPFNIGLLQVRVANLIASRARLRSLYGKSLVAVPEEGLTSADDRFLQKLYAVMEQNLSDPEFNIARFCREIGMSKTNLNLKIKALTNLSAGEFTRTMRLKAAAAMLRGGEVPISEIAVLVGFNSHAYFTSSFKALYGLPPLEWARINKE